jgi:hypothetical protein
LSKTVTNGVAAFSGCSVNAAGSGLRIHAVPNQALTPADSNPFNIANPTITFGDGIHLIGSSVPAGTYRGGVPSGSCYWARLSGLGGTLDEIITNSFSSIRQVVTILGADVAFESDGCGTWTSNLAAITASPTANFGDGVWIVGTDVAAGTWRASGGTGCYWERKNDFTGSLSAIIANNFTNIRQLVTVGAGDVGFETDGCGSWTRNLSAITPSPTSPFGDGMYIVATDVAAGTWSAPGGSSCYWERLNGFGGTLSNIIDNDFGTTNPVVIISAGDVGFSAESCGTWTKLA